MVLEIINQMSKNQKSSLIVWNTVAKEKASQFINTYLIAFLGHTDVTDNLEMWLK